MYSILDKGHSYSLKDRCPRGLTDCGTTQTLSFLKVKGGEVENNGLFTQDVIEVLINRAQWQHDNTPHEDPEVEKYRKESLENLKQSLINWNMYTEKRLESGMVLPGHEMSDYEKQED